MTGSSSPPSAARRVCLLTGGGDAPGLNAVIKGFVLRALAHGIEVIGSQDGFEGLVEDDKLVTMDAAMVRGILPRGGSILGCSNRANPFHYPVGPRGKEELRDVSDVVIRRLRENEIDALVLAGGDGTLHFGQKFSERGVHCVGVPKTIDNDLAATDYTFGFDTALDTATWAIDNLHATAASHHRVMILEVMGRYAGWIALSAGLAGGADVILIPEVPYRLDRILARIKERERLERRFTIIVVAEGARPEGGDHAILDAGHVGKLPRLGGAGERLMQSLKEAGVENEIRTTVLGHLQRGGSPSAFDRVLGLRMGAHAADLCALGDFGKMVCLRGTEIGEVPLAEATRAPKLVDPNGQLVQTAKGIGVELGF